MQTKKESHKEAVVNQVIGLALGWFVVYLFYPYLAYNLSPVMFASVSSVIFFVLSYARIYIIRRFFNGRSYGR